MPRQKSRPTSIPGVYYLGRKTYRIRVQIRRKGHNQVECDRVVQAGSLREAGLIKQKLIDEIQEYRAADLTTPSPSATNDKENGSEKKDAPGETAVERASKKRLGSYANAWLRGKQKIVAPSTFEKYINAVAHIDGSPIGKVRICDLTTEMIEAWRDAKGEVLASSSVKGHLNVLKAIVGRASRAARLGYDPSKDVQPLPGGDERTTKDEPNALTEKEFVKFIEAARVRRPRHFPAILTLLTTGVRVGSLRALRIEDLNQPKAGLIMVRRRVSKGKVLEGVKRSAASWDEVPLHPVLWEVLKNHIAGFSEAQRKSGLLFPNRKGKMWAASWLQKPFDDILAHAKIKKRFTPHGCRRTANDFYRRASSAVVTMAITGHVTKRMHKHYSTVSDEEKIGANSEAFDDVLNKNSEDATAFFPTPTASA